MNKKSLVISGTVGAFFGDFGATAIKLDGQAGINAGICVVGGQGLYHNRVFNVKNVTICTYSTLWANEQACCAS